MPSEVFAEDIEALLERLEGVDAARVVATDAGEIDRIYITASSDRDESRIRQTVTSALMSRYSLAIDGWRIRVARLRPDEGPRPRWFLQRVEEVLTAAEARVTVGLRSEASTVAALVGRAKGMTDAAGRLRAAALATLDALKSVFEAEDRRVTVESIAFTPMPSGKAVVVVLTVARAAAADRYVGAALVEGSETEAVVAATLDAVARRGEARERRGWIMRDRRDELESIEAHYRRLRGPQRQLPQPAHPPEVAAEMMGPAAPRADGEAADATEVAVPPEESDMTMEQLRPERQGGAEVVQPMNRPEMDRTRFTPKSSMEDEFIRHLMTAGIPVHVRCRDGYEIQHGIVRDFGTYSLLIETDAGRELVFKHGIISIRPMGARGS